MSRVFHQRSVMGPNDGPNGDALRIPLPLLSPAATPVNSFQLHFPQLEAHPNQFPTVGTSPTAPYSVSGLFSFPSSSSSTSHSASPFSSTTSSRSNSSTNSPPAVFKSTPNMFQCVLGDLSRLLDGNSPLQTDFTIITTKSLVKSSASGGHYQLERRIQRHQAHRFVLSFRSRYFESYFRFEANQGKDKGKEKDKDKDRKGKQASDELVLNDITGEVMAAILHYIYRGTFAYEPVHQLMDLMVAADHFLLDELVKSLTDTVIADLSPDKVVYVFKVASEHYNFDRLSKAATAYILEHGHLMLEEPSFLQSMTPDELVTFLSDDFFVVKEDNLIPFLFRYMKEHAIDQQENGLEVMSKLLDVVRFVLLADGPKLLATLDVNEELFFNLVVTKYDLAEERAAEIERRKLERKETEEKEAENISQSIINDSESAGDEDHPNFRNCIRFADVTIYAPQLEDGDVLLPNGASLFAVRAPLSLRLTFDRKLAIDRITYYVRCTSFLLSWFEWRTDDEEKEEEEEGARLAEAEADDDDVVVEFDRRRLLPENRARVDVSRRSKRGVRWFCCGEASAFGSNRALECRLSTPIYVRHMRLNLAPVSASDVTFFPVSVSNLAFTLNFPGEALLGPSKVNDDIGGGNNNNHLENIEQPGGENQNDEAPVFAF